MGNVAEKIWERVRGRARENQLRQVADVRELIVLLARHEMGESVEIDGDWAAELIEQAGLTEEDVRRNIDIVKGRYAKAKLAKDVDSASKAASDAEQAWRDADAEEGRRRQEAHRRLQVLESELNAAMTRSQSATMAHADLIAYAHTSDEELQLLEQQKVRNKKLREIEKKLNSRPPEVRPNLDFTVAQHPAALLRQTERDLAEFADKTAYVNTSPERKAKLESRLAAAKKATADAAKEKKALEKELANIRRKLDALAEAKLAPENFTLVRAQLSADERRMKNARDMGFHVTPPQHDRPSCLPTG